MCAPKQAKIAEKACELLPPACCRGGVGRRGIAFAYGGWQ